jgi:phage shock protein C
VCGGLGQYFNVNPMFMRLAFLLASGGSGALLYLFLWMVMPDEQKAR